MSRKLWGLFSGGQLTVIIVAALVAVTPGSLWAVASYQRVAVVDFKTGKKAQVDNQRRLQVYDQRLAVDELPANFVRFHDVAPTDCSVLAAPPAGKAMVVKTINLDVFQQDDLGGSYVKVAVGSTCISGIVAIVDSGIGVNTLNFEPGVVVPDGQFLWFGRSSVSVGAYVTGTGYLVPGAWAPASVAYDVTASPVGGAEALRRGSDG